MRGGSNTDTPVKTDGKYAALAPMAGVADRAFRELCISFGASFAVSEMVSSKGVEMNDRKSEQLMFLSEEEHPCAVQIFGCTPETMAVAAERALTYSPDFIDINMGCPAPKIANNGSGSALMKNPALAGEIVKACTGAVSLPVTVKIRAGWDESSINAVEMAKICEENGAAAITVHGRTRNQMYSPPVNRDIIREVKENVKIPVIGNGDVTDGPSALEMYRITGCDHIMVGRGALGRPWVFKMINEYIKSGTILPEPPVEERMEVMLRHIEKLCEYKGSYTGIREARKHSAWYIRGIRGAAKFRNELGKLETIDDLKAISEKVIEECRKNCSE